MFALTQNFSRSLAGAAGTLLFAGLCIAGATAPAQAQQAKQPISYTLNDKGERVAMISYRDINLASPEGRRRLENRVRTAARAVCHYNGQDPFATAAANRCYHNTMEATRAATMAAIASEKAVG
jgi:UrcA family protein